MEKISRWQAVCKGAVAVLVASMLAVSGSHAQQSEDQAWQADFREGTEAFTQGDLVTAAKSFLQVTQLQPQFPGGHFNLGLALLRMGHSSAAVSEFRTALKLDPKLRGGNLFLGIALYLSNQFPPARIAFQREISRDPKDAQALLWLGRTELALSNPAAASAVLEKASALDPENVDILYFCGRAHMLASKNAYDRMYKADPNSWRVHEALAQSYSDSGRHQQAIAEYETAIKLAPREPELHEWLGDEYLAAYNRAQAIRAYTAELAVFARNYPAMYSLGVVQVESNDARDGVETLRKAIAGDPSLTSAYYYLGWGEEKLGNYDAALKYLIETTRIHPSGDLAQRAYYQLSRVYRVLNRPADSRAALAQFTKMKQASDTQRNAKASALIQQPGSSNHDNSSNAGDESIDPQP